MKFCFLGHGSRQTINNDVTNFVFGDDYKVLVDSGPCVLKLLLAYGIPLNQISDIIITHKHADHYTGLPYLIWAIAKAKVNKIRLYASNDIIDHFRKLYHFINEKAPKLTIEYIPLKANSRFDLGTGYMVPFEVSHTVQTYGISIHSQERAIVFSSDTEICKEVERYSNKANVLIHDVFNLKSNKKGHSNAIDVAKIAQKCSVELLIPVHTTDKALKDETGLISLIKKYYTGEVIIPKDGQEIDI
jgi:ribonuclease Z